MVQEDLSSGECSDSLSWMQHLQNLMLAREKGSSQGMSADISASASALWAGRKVISCSHLPARDELCSLCLYPAFPPVILLLRP